MNEGDGSALDGFEYQQDMRVVNSARLFIKNLCEVYGTDHGMAAWDHIRRGLGDQIAGDIRTFAKIGVGELIFDFRGSSTAESIERLQKFAGEVLPVV